MGWSERASWLAPEQGGITRFDGERTNIIKGYTRDGALPIDVTREVLQGLEAEGFVLPAGYRIELDGATRHILSTTLTTIGGFLQLLLMVGGDFWLSLAIVLAGGVGGSMILALIFVPAVYVLTSARKGACWTEPTVVSAPVAAGARA